MQNCTEKLQVRRVSAEFYRKNSGASRQCTILQKNFSCFASMQKFTEKLQVRRVSAEFVPGLLTDGQKEYRVEMSETVCQCRW